MIRILPRNIIRFAFLVLLQVLVLNNIHFLGWINPFVYVLFILLMPFETPNWLLLLIAFALGMTIDSFSNTPGLHTSATLVMAYSRPFVLKLIAPREGYEAGTFPRMHYFGFAWFLKYSVILIFVHHIVLFSVEAFTWVDFHFTLARAIISALFSTLLILISQFIMYRK
ncbi:MAG: rod shape-determining protein MreD [Bacteroidales bacterium]|nr:rod shape-determining protein MreD [Bacteroidales bacterium]MCF8458067.1 rod shape-determining protein MreD [Bacteroidales bacterium]